nr:hypothetical protein [Tanacetum cinerariifolium]
KLAGTKPVYGPKTIKSILKSNSTFKAEALKGVTINEASSASAKASASKTNSAPAEELNKETLNKSQKVMKPVVALSIPQLITMTLGGLKGVKHFKLRKLKHSNPKD